MPSPDMMKTMFPQLSDEVQRKAFIAPPTLVDYPDLERRIADLEERAMRQDREQAARDRLRAMGLVLPNR